jgi:hypothetical protein
MAPLDYVVPLENVVDRALVIELGELQLEDTLTRYASPRLPAHGNFNEGLKSFGLTAEYTPLHAIDPPGLGRIVEIDGLLAQLRELDEDLLAGFHSVVRPVHPVDVITRNDNGRLERRVAALICDADARSLCIPVAFPVDKPILALLGDRLPYERVRLLTEFVRIFGDLVGTGGDSVRCLGQLVGYLRAAIRDAREHESGDTDRSGSADADPRGDVDHVESVAKVVA